MLAFFPLNDGSRPVRALYWGGHAGMGSVKYFSQNGLQGLA